jgi:RNA polymerase sigma factor (sigma-70 family)
VRVAEDHGVCVREEAAHASQATPARTGIVDQPDPHPGDVGLPPLGQTVPQLGIVDVAVDSDERRADRGDLLVGLQPPEVARVDDQVGARDPLDALFGQPPTTARKVGVTDYGDDHGAPAACNEPAGGGHSRNMAPRPEASRTLAASVERPARRSRFERIFAAHYRAVFAYALRRATRAEAEDAVAETFLVAWRRLEHVPDPAKPWLLGVARRALANQRRSSRRQQALGTRLAHEPPSPAEPSGETPVLEALGRLSDDDRELLLLIAWDGLTAGEAAAVLDCTPATLRVRLHRARRRLRSELEDLEGSEAARSTNPTPRLEECP